jgi:hypothetical protein
MIQRGMLQKLHDAVDGTRLGVGGSIDQTLDAGVDHGAGTHGARFDCNKQLTADEAMVAEGAGGVTQGNDLGMGGGVTIGEIAIAAAANDLILEDDNGADRDLPAVGGAAGLLKGEAHEGRV